jgi:hypothetical protein
MPNAVNLWSLLPEATKRNLKQLADGLGTDLIYVRHNAYYERRNSFIQRRYNQLERETSMTKLEIYDKIKLKNNSGWTTFFFFMYTLMRRFKPSHQPVWKAS